MISEQRHRFKDLSLLYLSSREEYLHKMSRVRFHAVRTMEKFCSVLWSGPGWDNWDDTKGLAENIRSLYKEKKPDLIFCYHPYKIKEFSQIDIPVCVSYNEMGTAEHPRSQTVREILENRIDLAVCHHLNEMRYPEFNDLPCKFVNISHCIDRTIFKDYGFEKDWDILLVGQINPIRYPLRVKLSKMILKMREDPRFIQYHIGVLPHPGARISEAYTDREAIRFAQSINRSKICLTCSGIHRCRYAKYSEIPACRSLLMADLPDEDHAFFRQFMAVIEPDDTYESVSNKILYYLQNDSERESLTESGYELTQGNYTQEHYAVRFLTAVEEYLKEYGGKKITN